ncbi:hypothetical protein [Cupriavidus sp. CuC1]|uniref:hypothetical protein n=1 Tax=Cupriavidus sp. CuC1 TaxID=3373131 RepID=UPI0037CD75A3
MAAAEQPDPFRAKFRQAISEVVAHVVRDREPLIMVIADLGLEAEAAIQLKEMVKGDLSRLGEHNFSRYRLRMKEVQLWLADGRPEGD